ncbi:methyltransferase domain-containing protein [Salinisphaera sp. SPP-AMP-43]|uniref:methyltransferase domain-containing protein n=1 Tax=Salinisphaera sp. SPP-AMP-43 TaxID=3121288 RepID=UPI003C6E84FF
MAGGNVNQAFKKIIRTVTPPTVLEKCVMKPLMAYRGLKPIAARHCNLCDYRGYFGIKGRPPRLDARCPRCGSFERHRLLMLAMDRAEVIPEIGADEQVLHFAAEPVLVRHFRKRWGRYQTADLFFDADLKLNLEDIDLPDASVRLIIANHVLEHVDDYKAASELHRILVDGGVLVCMVPIIEGWAQTYENEAIQTQTGRWLHFGQGDHRRYYGRDFRARIASAGLQLAAEVTAEGEELLEYGLLRGEKVFMFRKPLATTSAA